MKKPADTTLPLMNEIKNRWSPRAFDTHPVEPEKLERIFEAARWSASCFNEQPWRFIVGLKEQDDAWDKIYHCLTETNKIWCKSVPVLILLVAKNSFSHNDRLNKWAVYDLGQSAAYICMQATAEGLYVHQMAGFDAEEARSAFSVPDNFEIKTAMAVGYFGDPENLPDKLKKSELSKRSRKEIPEIVYSGAWGSPVKFIKS
ncbi:MAG: nitroreductase family protein [Calditrichaceae bacterium]|jgi:nitroreductase